MKTYTFLTVCLLFISVQLTYAQNQKFRELKCPHFEVSTSIGLIPTFVKEVSRADVPPLGLTVDYRMSRRYSIGLYAGYTRVMSTPDVFKNGEQMLFDTRFSMVGARFAVHAIKYKRWDPYGGFGINYTHSNIDVIEGDMEKLILHKNFKSHKSKMMFSAFIGSKFAVSPTFSIYGEVGYGISLINVGISRRFCRK